MKAIKKILCAGLMLLTWVNVFSEDMDAKIKKAVDDLVTPLNAPMEISVGSVTIAETSTPSAFSRYLHNKINFFAVANGMYKVVENSGSSRSAGWLRPVKEQSGEVSGTYQKIGGLIEVTLYLKFRSGGALISSSGFSISAAEVEKMGIPVLPANNSAETQAREKEKIFTPLPEAGGFRIEAWTDSASGTYFEGDTMNVYFVSDKNCYYKMYYINTSGKMNLIYPTRRNNNNFLRANTVKEMKFDCIPPYGNETFLLIASEDPITINNADFAEVEADVSAIEQVIRGLQYQENTRSAAPIAAARFSYTILPAN